MSRSLLLSLDGDSFQLRAFVPLFMPSALHDGILCVADIEHGMVHATGGALWVLVSVLHDSRMYLVATGLVGGLV
jgi:hypothetical protein